MDITATAEHLDHLRAAAQSSIEIAWTAHGAAARASIRHVPEALRPALREAIWARWCALQPRLQEAAVVDAAQQRRATGMPSLRLAGVGEISLCAEDISIAAIRELLAAGMEAAWQHYAAAADRYEAYRAACAAGIFIPPPPQQS